MNIDYELKLFKQAIDRNKLMESWRDGLFVKTEEEAEQRAQDKAKEAESSFMRIMQSPKNDGSESYREWATNTALGLKQGKHRVRFRS